MRKTDIPSGQTNPSVSGKKQKDAKIKGGVTKIEPEAIEPMIKSHIAGLS